MGLAKTSMNRTIRLKTFLPYKKHIIWSALTQKELLSKWFMENNIEPRINHEFEFKMAPQRGWDGITHCKIIAIEAGSQISYTYCGEATGEKAMACAGIHSEKVAQASKGIFAALNTILTFRLEPTCGGTLLFMEQSGYEGVKMMLISLIMQMGWKKQLRKKLPKLLEAMQVEQ